MSENFTPAVVEPTAPLEVTPTPVAPVVAAPSIPAGWHPHNSNPGLLQYWDGSAWTEHTAPATQPPGAAPAAMPQIVIQNSASVGGYGRRTNHVLHLILTVLTAGLWLPVWVVVAVLNRSKGSAGGGGNVYR